MKTTYITYIILAILSLALGMYCDATSLLIVSTIYLAIAEITRVVSMATDSVKLYRVQFSGYHKKSDQYFIASTDKEAMDKAEQLYGELNYGYRIYRGIDLICYNFYGD